MILLSRRIAIVTLAATALTVLMPFSLSAQARKPLSIVATTGMIADAARQIGGELVEVKGLMGPGVDPHAYRQTRTDILAMTKADLILWHGLYLEAQMEDFMRQLAARQNVVAVAETLPKDLLLSHETYTNKHDPHVWMTPALWSKVVTAIGEALIEAMPEERETLQANAEKHLQDIAALEDYTAKVLATVPAAKRVLVTAHDAFNYFGRAYDFEVLGIQGISTESEAGLSRVAELVDLMVERKIGAVFVESSVSDRNIRAIIEGAASRGHDVRVGGELFSDAMGEPGAYEGTYIGMIDHNATIITRALNGDAPERGMSGRLSTGS